MRGKHARVGLRPAFFRARHNRSRAQGTTKGL